VTNRELVDIRQPGEYSCEPNLSFHTTVFGVPLLAAAQNKLKPDAPVGDEIFQIKMRVSGDCSSLEPIGFNTQRTRQYVSETQTKKATSIMKLSRTHSQSLAAKMGVQAGGVSASSSMSYKTSEEDAKTHERVNVYFLSEKTNIDTTISISGERPAYSEAIEKLLQDFRKNPSVDNGRRLGRKLYNFGTHVTTGAEIGSKMTVVSICEPKCVCFCVCVKMCEKKQIHEEFQPSGKMCCRLSCIARDREAE
jgi:hypothetical protein